jgi:hypothetical protein
MKSIKRIFFINLGLLLMFQLIIFLYRGISIGFHSLWITCVFFIISWLCFSIFNYLFFGLNKKNEQLIELGNLAEIILNHRVQIIINIIFYFDILFFYNFDAHRVFYGNPNFLLNFL